MKKTLVVIALILIVTTSAFVLTACDGTLTFSKLVKFDIEDVEYINLKSEYGVIKEVREDINKVFEAFSSTIFVKTEEAKYEADWGIDRKMTIDFYIKGKEGYYSLILNTGVRAMDGYKGKSVTGFYHINDIEDVLIKLNKIFYQS